MPAAAFIDESSMPSEIGHVYVLGIVRVLFTDEEECKGRLTLAAGRQERIHFAESSSTLRSTHVALVSELPAHITSIASKGPRRSEERTRRRLLAAVFGSTSCLLDGVDSVVLESRGNALDLRDKSLIQQVSKFTDQKSRRIRHVGWRNQPMLWAADVVAGSVSRALTVGEAAPFPVNWI
jgi:hypothetical protein